MPPSRTWHRVKSASEWQMGMHGGITSTPGYMTISKQIVCIAGNKRKKESAETGQTLFYLQLVPTFSIVQMIRGIGILAGVSPCDVHLAHI
jgi:hypothetical protein